MEPRYSEPPRELDDLSVPAVVVCSDAAEDNGTYTGATSNRGSCASLLPTQHAAERPKVRFNSKENFPTEPRKTRGIQPRNLRPALTRNPDSSGLASGDVADEPLSTEKAASAAAAAQRAYEVAMDTQDESNRSSRRWSTESEVPMAHSYASQMQERSLGAKLAAEAGGLLKAHTQSLQTAFDHRGTFLASMHSHFSRIVPFRALNCLISH
jgi:hypothetical protein